MDIDVDKICQDLMNNIASALTQYYYLADFLYYEQDRNDEHLFNWGSNAHSITQNYSFNREKQAKYADLIIPINLGIHLIDKLSYKIKPNEIAEAYKRAKEEMDYIKFHGSMPGSMQIPYAKEVYNLFADNGESLKTSVIKIHDQYFELIVARVNQIKENKK